MQEHPHHIDEYMLEIRRGKALATIVEAATVTDSNGDVVELARIQPDGSLSDPSVAAEVEGATTGRLTRYTFTDNGGSQLTGTWVVAARWPSPQSVAVSFLTPQPDPELERRVLESLVLDADG